jgi:hypothetical protein
MYFWTTFMSAKFHPSRISLNAPEGAPYEDQFRAKQWPAYQDFLQRAGAQELAKQYKPYPDTFGDEDCIYFKIDFQGESFIEHSLRHYLENCSKYLSLDYKNLLVISRKNLQDIHETYKGDDSKIYNVLQSSSIKLGKLLQEDPINGLVVNAYKDACGDITRSPFILAISRDPFQIATMSSGRKWEEKSEGNNCMTFQGWRFEQSFAKLLQHNALIAYIIKEDDPLIQQPLSRIALNPYVNERQESILICSGETRGVVNYKAEDDIKDIVQNIVDSHFNKEKYGSFNRIEEIQYFRHERCFDRWPAPTVEMGLWLKQCQDLSR